MIIPQPSLSLLSTLLLLGSALAAPEVVLPSHENNTLESRADHSNDGTLYCGNFATGSKNQGYGIVYDLRFGKLKNEMWSIWKGSCRRVHCYDTTAIYVCNDANKYITLQGDHIGNLAWSIYDDCCEHDGISGQKFVKTNGLDYNVVLGYGNCGHSNFVKPSTEGGQGINSRCVGGDTDPYESK